MWKQDLGSFVLSTSRISAKGNGMLIGFFLTYIAKSLTHPLLVLVQLQQQNHRNDLGDFVTIK